MAETKKWGLVIDVTRCDGCGSCLLSVKDEYTGNDYPGYAAVQPKEGVNWLWLKEVEQGHGTKIKMDYIPVMFPHNRNFKLSDIPGAPEGSVYVRPDGLTVIDPVKAKGCKAIYEYFEKVAPGTVFWNEELQLPQKCTMCAELMDDPDYPGKEPRCVEACPNQALVYGDLDDPKSEISKLIKANKVTPLEGLGKMKTQVVHLNVPSRFLAGTVYYPAEEEEVVIGAKVKVTCDSCGKVYETETNWAGDWEIENLPKDELFTVEISFPGYKTVKYNKQSTKTDHYVGMTYLKKK